MILSVPPPLPPTTTTTSTTATTSPTAIPTTTTPTPTPSTPFSPHISVDAVPIPSGWRLLLPNSYHVFPNNLFTIDNLPTDMSPTHRFRCMAFVDNPVAFRITASDNPDIIGSETATLCPICGLIVKDNWVATRNGRLRRQLRIESLREHLGMRHHLMNRVQCPAQCSTVCASRGYTKPHRLLHHWSDNIACLVWVADRVEDDDHLANLVQWSLGAAWKRASARNQQQLNNNNNNNNNNNKSISNSNSNPNNLGYVDLLALLIDRAAHVRKVTKTRMRELMARASTTLLHRGVLPFQRTVSSSSVEPIFYPPHPHQHQHHQHQHPHHNMEFISSSASSHSSSSISPPPPPITSTTTTTSTHLPSPNSEPFSLTRPLDLSASQAGPYSPPPLPPPPPSSSSSSSSSSSYTTLTTTTTTNSIPTITDPIITVNSMTSDTSLLHVHPTFINSPTSHHQPFYPHHHQHLYHHLDPSIPPAVFQSITNHHSSSNNNNITPIDHDISPLMIQSRPWSAATTCSYTDAWPPTTTTTNSSSTSNLINKHTSLPNETTLRNYTTWIPSSSSSSSSSISTTSTSNSSTLNNNSISSYSNSSPVATCVSSDPFLHLRSRQQLNHHHHHHPPPHHHSSTNTIWNNNHNNTNHLNNNDTSSPTNGSLESLLALEDLGFRWGQTVRD